MFFEFIIPLSPVIEEKQGVVRNFYYPAVFLAHHPVTFDSNQDIPVFAVAVKAEADSQSRSSPYLGKYSITHQLNRRCHTGKVECFRICPGIAAVIGVGEIKQHIAAVPHAGIDPAVFCK